MTISADVDSCMREPEISGRIFYHLSYQDLLNCTTVNKTWYVACRTAKRKRKIEITPELVKESKGNYSQLVESLRSERKFATDLEIYGWSQKIAIPNEFYNHVIDSRLQVKRLVLHGRGKWISCRCPSISGPFGTQFDTVKSQDKTALEYINIASPFTISSCALLDLVSRSPKLKELRFYGLIDSPDHHKKFMCKLFHCNIERVYWPWPTKDHIHTLTIIVKRNENINTLYSNTQAICALLATELVPNLRHLSIMMNEDWRYTTIRVKKAYKLLKNIDYLSLAKKVEALEVRTFDPELLPETEEEVGRIFENYRLAFWDKVASLTNLKYLGIFGSWEMEEVCRELAKHGIQTELLKINLLPKETQQAVDNHDDRPTLSMASALRNLRKLPKLRSLYYICYEKLGNVDISTATALKELNDLIWILDIKTIYTDEVGDMLNSILKRGSQLGKLYKITIHIQSRNPQLCSIVESLTLKNSPGPNLKEKFVHKANMAMNERYGKNSIENIQIWGIEQCDNYKDRKSYEKLNDAWKYYDGIFKASFMFI